MDYSRYVSPPPSDVHAANLAVVGVDLDFPFAFMRGKTEESLSSSSSRLVEPDRPKSGMFLVEHSIQTQSVDLSPPITITAPPRTDSTASYPSQTQPKRRRSTKAVEATNESSEKRRRVSWTSVEELKMPKLGRGKFSFLVGFGRWSR